MLLLHRQEVSVPVSTLTKPSWSSLLYVLEDNQDLSKITLHAASISHLSQQKYAKSIIIFHYIFQQDSCMKESSY